MAELNDYRSAIVERFPELELQTIEYLAHGIDHVACRVNGNLIFRFPKRAEAEAKLLIEMRLLPALAPTLPLPIPNFDYLSPEPSASFPYAFVGYRLLRGEPLTTYIPTIWDETWWTRALGEFLIALHSFPLRRAKALGVPGGTTEWWRNRYLDLY
jgi:aminoglycoside 2''-phosphotransferase